MHYSRQIKFSNTASRSFALRSRFLFAILLAALIQSVSFGADIVPADEVVTYADDRPAAKYRMDAQDAGVVLRHGDGPGQCDYLGARDVWAWENHGTYYMHYDGAGLKGWLACLATSKDLIHWEKKGPVLDFGKPGSEDSASASYGTTYFDGKQWHLYYLGTPHTTSSPDFIPAFPYLTMEAVSARPSGPWVKLPQVTPFRPQPGTYYNCTASPGQIIKQGREYLMFFSASMKRTIGIARTKDLEGAWTIDPSPIVPAAEQIENSSIYFEPANQTWFLFSNHVGVENGNEYTDAVWVYWTHDLNHWNPAHKAVVLDGKNCNWSRKCIGLPSVVRVNNQLAIFYDAPGGDSTSHMNRDVGLAWLNLPLNIPLACFQNANGCHFVRDGAAPSTKSPPSPVSSPPGRGCFWATFSGIRLRHSLIQSRVFLKTLGAFLPLLEERAGVRTVV